MSAGAKKKGRARSGKVERAGRGKVGATAKKAAPLAEAPRDALGRRRRAERVRIEGLKALRGPRTLINGQPPIVAWFGRVARGLRAELGLSKRGMAELCGIERATVRSAELGERGVMLCVLGAYAWGANLTLEEMGRRLDRARQDLAKPGRSGVWSKL